MISICIVEYGDPELLNQCVRSIEKFTTLPYKILVHNNNPPNENIGFARGVNKLIRKSQSNSDILLLNPDTVVGPNWIEPLYDEHSGIVQSRLVRPNGEIDSTGHEWRWKFHTIPIVGDRRREGSKELTTCSFACTLIRREVIEQIGLLDEKYFMFWEDVDYCLRARRKGWRVRYCPSSTILHVRHGTTGGTNIRNNASYHHFLRKHYPLGYVLRLVSELYMKMQLD